MRRTPGGPLPWLATLAALVAVGACSTPGEQLPPAEAQLGDPDRGAALITDYGCGSCHVIPGLEQADGLVGPPLTSFGRRMYIAGNLPNNAENLQYWIREPQDVEPGTAMPDLGVSRVDARDIAAYLLTLE
ncbi:Cytochrome c2 [Blastococcus sp. DSM 46786]|uniref:c-type cytochrome n=1 Tax=Blastococcus sp. DSM 46786 TaxID=1798227 RepID=UPI0008CDDFE6|nr:c-type cytochrome [Blastococcus sp. DSM 46786]SEK69374.1 Cytochrome c2 [Blastococcus sp. DSM 46786]